MKLEDINKAIVCTNCGTFLVKPEEIAFLRSEIKSGMGHTVTITYVLECQICHDLNLYVPRSLGNA